jgi:hypothetical protein
MMTEATYSFVRLPCDDGAPLEEVSLPCTGFEDDSLKPFVKAALGGVEITLLLAPTAASRFESVSVYSAPTHAALLAAGAAPPARANARATALCRACGHPPDSAPVLGDAFLSRCVDDERGDVWERRALRADEARPGAAWPKGIAGAHSAAQSACR